MAASKNEYDLLIFSCSPQQQSPPDSLYSPEEEMPVYYEEDDDDSVEEFFLLDDYLFSLDLILCLCYLLFPSALRNHRRVPKK